MKRNRTKKSLILSVTALLLCVSMFASSTYAWFTDEVSSGVNQIIAGNLDVELQHKVGADYESVEGQTGLFKNALGDIILWEPGAVAAETFKVSNVGSLALKYKLHFNNISNNYVSGTTKSLLDVIKVGIVEDTLETTREAVIAQVTSWTTLTDFIASVSNEEGHLSAGENDEFSVVLYWEPNDNAVDNQYNLKNGLTSTDGNPLYVDLGLTLVATQDTVEADSFNNQYDALATYPVDQYEGVSMATATTAADSGSATLNAGAAPSNTNNTTSVQLDGLTVGGAAVVDGANIKLDVETSNVITANNEDYAVTGAGSDTEAIATIDLTLTGGADAFDKATISTYITKNLNTVSIVYNSNDTTVAFGTPVSATVYETEASMVVPTAVGTAAYAKDTGKLVFVTDHFSEYLAFGDVVAWNANTDTVYASLPTAVSVAAAGDTLILLDNANLTSILMLTKDIVIDGNGYDITNTANRVIRVTQPNLKVSIYNCGIISKCTSNSDVRAISFDNAAAGSSLLLDGCNLSASFYVINAVPGADNLNVVIKNGTIAAGWAALNTYSNNSTYSIVNSTLKGLNDKGESEWNNFNTITFDGNCLYGTGVGQHGSNNNMSISNSTIYASSENGNKQSWIGIQYGATGNSVTVDKDTRIINSNGEDMSNLYLIGWYCNYSGGYNYYYENDSVIKVGKYTITLEVNVSEDHKSYDYAQYVITEEN